MIKSFSDIEDFFLKDTFSQKELETFKQDISAYYKDDQVLKKALELVELKISFYELASKYDKKTSYPSSQDNTSAETNNKTKSKPSDYTLTKKDRFLASLWYKSPRVIAEYLKVSEAFIISLYKQKGILLDSSSIISEDHINLLSDYFLNRRKQLGKIQKKDSIIKKDTKYQMNKNNGISHSIKVYDDLLTYGMSKLIYIRKK